MRRQSLLLEHAVPILLASSLVLSAHPLWAQKSPPLEENQARMFDRLIVTGSRSQIPSGSVPETLPEASRSQTESHENLFGISYHHTLINTQAALNPQQPAGTAELQGTTKYFTGSASSQWLTSAYGKVHYPTIQPADYLQYYGRHVPWAGSTILRVSQLAKAHPHVTNVLKLVKPKF